MEKRVMLLRTMSILTLLFSFIFVSCSPKHSEIVLSKFGDKEIKMEEFETAYAKNAGGFEQAKNDSLSKLKSFLDLYTNFQMKLRDASVRGYSNDSTLKMELSEYKKKVGVTYILEKQLVEPAIKKYYERRKYELRVSHIMFTTDSATNDAAAKKLAEQVLERIQKGEKYEELCAKYSKDKFTKDKGGDIYYLTAGMLPPEFDEVCYNTPVGTVNPQVLHTRWGYHIVKVTDKRERTPMIRASHIMIGFTPETGGSDSVVARQKIDSIMVMLKQGKDFAELAKKYSTDSGTKDNGGDLGLFERRKMVPEFDEPAFKLNVNQISDVIKTSFGFHIIKVTDKKPYQSFENEKEELKKIYKQVSYNADYDKLVESLKLKFGYKVNDDVYNLVTTNNDTATLVPSYLTSKFGKAIGGKVLFTLNNKSFTADSVLNLCLNQPEFANKPIDTVLLKSILKSQVADLAMGEEAMNFDKVNPEFSSLMEDYKNGIYIFKLQDEEVWGKISLDSTKLANFYKGTKPNYVMPDRVSFNELFVTGDSLKTLVNKLLKEGQNYDSVAAQYSSKKGDEGKTFVWALTDVATNELSEAAGKLAKVGDSSEAVPFNGGFAFVKLLSKEVSRLKTFEEAKAEVSGAFQESEGKRLDLEYLNQLKNIYKPVFNYENLEKAYKAE